MTIGRIALWLPALLALLGPLPVEAAAGAEPDQPPQTPTDTLTDLASVLDTGRVLLDRNGDSLVDFIDLRLLLAPQPTESEVAAASNLAARLGYETIASDLGLAFRLDPDSPGATLSGATHGVLVGRGAVEAAGRSAEEWIRGLAPGDGAVGLLTPDASLPRGGLAVVGYDASGLLAAAGYLAARFPAVWDPEGDAWTEVTGEVEAYLEGEEVADAVASLERIVVRRGQAGVARAEVSVALPDLATVDRLVESLAQPDSSAGEDTPDLEFEGLRRLDLRLTAPGGTRVVPIRPEEPQDIRPDAAFRPGSDPEFGLPQLYSIDGLFRDTNRDLVPDETAAYISLGGADAPESVVDLATRIGLETAGIRLPIVRLGGEEDDPEAHGFPILVGSGHYQTERLQEAGQVRTASGSQGEGFVQLVDGAFGDRGALVVGGDEGGLGAALDWLAGRAPYLWTFGKGEYGLADAETEVRRFFQARKAPGQVALAVAKLGTWMDRATDDPPARVEIELAALETPEGLGAVLEDVVRERFPRAQVSAESWPTGFGVGDTVFVQEWDIPWEVDELRDVLGREVFPGVARGQPAQVEVRVSEPPELRAALADEIRRELIARGATDPEVSVLSAYKQGYSWLNDVVLPRLAGTPGVATLEIHYHTLEESEEVRWQTVAADTRWLQEIYPIEAILSRDIGIDDSLVTFHPTRRADPVYEIVALDANGDEILRDSFNPRYVVRPFFDLFPEYEQVRVTTGWITATSGGQTLADQRIVTDPERFWDRLQTESYGAITEYVMDTQDGSPSSANAPYFDEFRIDLRLSEPNYRIGVDEEVISSLEALHEDIYFETLTLFDLIGGRYGTSLPYPGRVLPYIDANGVGQPGKARLTFTGKERGTPEIVVRSWGAEDGEPTLTRYGLGSLPVEDPVLTGVTVEGGTEGLRRLLVRVEAVDSVDRYEEFRERSREATIDRQFLSVELLEGMVEGLRRLHGVGLFQDALSWDRVGELAVDFRVTEDSLFHRAVVLPRTAAPRGTDNPRLMAEGWTWGGERLTQWDSPIPPVESDSILARLASFPEARAYYLTDSFLGQRVWAADFTAPHEERFVSQAKLNALKPTLLISGRQHANEVSSTSHILRLGELLVTDSTYRRLLDDVNVVLHPITNPDGARLAVEMQETNPDFMLHAGYLGALGVDATSGERDPDAMYPESQARRILRETWLPDIYINMHGYPSHEWVQYFAGYSAWVRSRRGGQRSWWTPRGWFIPGFSWVDDDENPEYRTAQFAILDSVAAAMTAAEDIDAVSRRLYRRYKRYGEQDRAGFTEYFHNGILVSLGLRGGTGIGNGPFSTRITYFSTTTEAPDETARGPWLETVATMGLTHSSALLRYLASGTYEIEREYEGFDGSLTRRIFRVKPVLPSEAGDGADPITDEGRGARRPGG